MFEFRFDSMITIDYDDWRVILEEELENDCLNEQFVFQKRKMVDEMMHDEVRSHTIENHSHVVSIALLLIYLLYEVIYSFLAISSNIVDIYCDIC